jgi:hypothetical protein
MTTETFRWAKYLLVGLGLGGVVVGAAACAPAADSGVEVVEVDDVDASHAPVSCSNSHGPVQTLVDVQEVYAAIEGDWRICTPMWKQTPADAIGVRFGAASATLSEDGSTPGGLAYFLVDGPEGPTPGSGFGYQLTYDVSQEEHDFQVNMQPLPNEGIGGNLVFFSPSPRELQLWTDLAPWNLRFTAL